MDTTDTTPSSRLAADDPSVRLRAALAAGSTPDLGLLETLVQRCGVEPDPFVRDMLTWALIRLPPAVTLPRLRLELGSGHARARSQALHTLSKIGDPGTWAWITRDVLRDPDDEVARTAWRVAVDLVPDDGRAALAEDLVTQLGRGDPQVQLSLSRALVRLGDAAEPALTGASAHPDPEVAAHARATEQLRQDPGAGLAASVQEAERVARLGPERTAAAAAAMAKAKAAAC